MNQNRNKLVDLLIGNLSNAILHKILEEAILENIEIAKRYEKEILNSWQIAKSYRDKINPINSSLPSKDIGYISEEITRRLKSEIALRISKGYKNLSLESIEPKVHEALKEMKIKD